MCPIIVFTSTKQRSSRWFIIPCHGYFLHQWALNWSLKSGLFTWGALTLHQSTQYVCAKTRSKTTGLIVKTHTIVSHYHNVHTVCVCVYVSQDIPLVVCV